MISPKVTPLQSPPPPPLARSDFHASLITCRQIRASKVSYQQPLINHTPQKKSPPNMHPSFKLAVHRLNVEFLATNRTVDLQPPPSRTNMHPLPPSSPSVQGARASLAPSCRARGTHMCHECSTNRTPHSHARLAGSSSYKCFCR